MATSIRSQAARRAWVPEFLSTLHFPRAIPNRRAGFFAVASPRERRSRRLRHRGKQLVQSPKETLRLLEPRTLLVQQNKAFPWHNPFQVLSDSPYTGAAVSNRRIPDGTGIYVCVRVSASVIFNCICLSCFLFSYSRRFVGEKHI
jgi:hypothetical protein